MMFDANLLSKTLDIRVENAALFHEALTHRSYLNEHKNHPVPHNERLEFLGDAVLELVVTERLYADYPDRPEGELTALRAALVNSDMLAKVGYAAEVEQFLLMSRGEAKDTGRARSYLVANVVEAIIGALYLDRGYSAAQAFIETHILNRIQEVLDAKLYTDPKSRFQELAQEKQGITPQYRVLRESGPDHDRRFIAGVYIGDELVAEGEGLSKQDAQRNAAKEGLSKKGW